MDKDISKQLTPGTRVEVIQQLPHGAAGDEAWVQRIHGTVVSHELQPTGSWFAHARGDKLWLDRLTIREDDGEVTVLNLDQYSVVRIEKPPPGQEQRRPKW